MRLMHQRMVLVREIEELIVRHYDEQEMRCPMHLGIGQEGVSAGICASLRPEDYIFGTYRSHGIYLAKGGDPKTMLAEFYGKSTGQSAGRAGSMQLTAPEIGFLCASALVGGTIPMAVGAALASKLRRDGRIAIAFFGDAASSSAREKRGTVASKSTAKKPPKRQAPVRRRRAAPRKKPAHVDPLTAPVKGAERRNIGHVRLDYRNLPHFTSL